MLNQICVVLLVVEFFVYQFKFKSIVVYYSGIVAITKSINVLRMHAFNFE